MEFLDVRTFPVSFLPGTIPPVMTHPSLSRMICLKTLVSGLCDQRNRWNSILTMSNWYSLTHGMNGRKDVIWSRTPGSAARFWRKPCRSGKHMLPELPCGNGAPPAGVGGSKKFFLLSKQKETMATSRSRRRTMVPDEIGGLLRCG